MITEVEIREYYDGPVSGTLRWDGLLYAFRYDRDEGDDDEGQRVYRLTPLELQWRSPTAPEFVSEDDLYWADPDRRELLAERFRPFTSEEIAHFRRVAKELQ